MVHDIVKMVLFVAPAAFLGAIVLVVYASAVDSSFVYHSLVAVLLGYLR